jgi:hypothetical protein
MQAKALIRDAFEIAQIADPSEEPEGDDLSTGLTILNDILALWASQPAYARLRPTRLPLISKQDNMSMSYLAVDNGHC